jgi:RimJ/RimL family protein N-acetyltransferase
VADAQRPRGHEAYVSRSLIYCGDANSWRSLGPSDDIETTNAWIEGCIESPVKWIFAIELLDVATEPQQIESSPPVIGMIGAVREPGEIGYMFKSEFWGKGYATEALRGFLPLFFDHYPGGGETYNEFAQANTDSELIKSQNVLTKTGFVLYEKRIKNFQSPTLGWRDIWVYRKYRTE